MRTNWDPGTDCRSWSLSHWSLLPSCLSGRVASENHGGAAREPAWQVSAARRDDFDGCETALLSSLTAGNIEHSWLTRQLLVHQIYYYTHAEAALPSCFQPDGECGECISAGPSLRWKAQGLSVSLMESSSELHWSLRFFLAQSFLPPLLFHIWNIHQSEGSRYALLFSSLYASQAFLQ